MESGTAPRGGGRSSSSSKSNGEDGPLLNACQVSRTFPLSSHFIHPQTLKDIDSFTFSLIFICEAPTHMLKIARWDTWSPASPEVMAGGRDLTVQRAEEAHSH